MKLYSTLDKKVVQLEPIKEGSISMYNCGPTVYYKMQVGNIRAYVNWDVMHRAFTYLGYKVDRVMNLTDVGHMTSDEDFGEDKIDKQASKEGVEPIEVANKYIDTILDDFRKLNILAPNGEPIPKDLDHTGVSSYGFTRATEYVDEMIEVVKKMEANGYTYETGQAVYFDVTKIPDYTIFTGQKLEDKEVGVRDEVGVDPEKRHPADFVLWMKRVGKYENHIMNWESPWGNGFPGWHIECTAMSTAVLGEYFDIHTGGIDHVPVHHPNERAQNIGAFGHPSVKYWIHNEWVVTKDDKKLSKSEGNALELSNVLSLGFDPMDLRYLFISINYRTKIQFSTEALEGARNARVSLENKIKELGNTKGEVLGEYKERFEQELRNNLNMSGVLALINELLKSDNSKEDILATVLDFDRVLGLDLGNLEDEAEDIPEQVRELVSLRQNAREEKNYEESDNLRAKIEQLGYIVKDTSDGQKVEKI